MSEPRNINWVLALLMSLFFGTLGVDRFIMGHIFLGILKLITAGGFGIWWLIDVILIASRYPFKNINWVDQMATESLTNLIARKGNERPDLLPLSTEKNDNPKPKDWIKITALVVLVIAGLVAAFSGLCLSGMFPIEIFGGTHNTLFTLFGTGLIAVSAGGIFYYRWKKPD